MPAPTPRCLGNEIQPLLLDAQLLPLTTRVWSSQEILADEPKNADALAAYGVLLGKHLKEYELAEQVISCCAKALLACCSCFCSYSAACSLRRCRASAGFLLTRFTCQVLRLAVHERPQDRSLHILHLHAQGLFLDHSCLLFPRASMDASIFTCRSLAHFNTDSANTCPELAHYAGPRGVDLDIEEVPPPPKTIGAGPTRYGAMCEPPADQAVGWAERPFQDLESHMRETYVERYAKVLEEEQEGHLAAVDVRMQPKVTDRGKANKLFCNYVEDKPTGLEAPFNVRRGNLVWPDEWYVNKTVKTMEAMDEDTELSKGQILQLVDIFKAVEQEAQAEEKKRGKNENVHTYEKQPLLKKSSTLDAVHDSLMGPLEQPVGTRAESSASQLKLGK